MKISTGTLLYTVGIILLLASIPTEWFQMKGDSFGTLTVTGLNGYFVLFGISTPLWVLVLIGGIGMALGFCRSLGWTDMPAFFCFLPTAAVLLSLVFEVTHALCFPDPAAAISEWGAGIVLAGVGLALGLGARLYTAASSRGAADYDILRRSQV